MPELTSRERVRRAAHRLPTDCVAAMPYMYDIAAVTAGIPLQQFYTDPQAMVRAQLALHERVGQDVIAIGSDNFYIAEGFGCQTTRGDTELPALVKPPLTKMADVFDLEVPDPYTQGRMPVMLEALRLARKAVGDEVALRSPGTGPFAAEGPTIAKLHAFIADQGYALTGKHHEIYLSDFRRTAPEKLKTVIRQPVAKVS